LLNKKKEDKIMKRRILTLLLAFAMMSSLSAFAAEKASDEHSHEGCVVETFAIDWSEYAEELSEVKYKLRVYEKLEPEIEMIILTHLVADGVIPGDILSAHSLAFEYESIFSQFIDENVEVEYLPYGVVCCDPTTMRKTWVPIWGGTMHANGMCTRHCQHDAYICQGCQAIWDSRHVITDPYGCGKTAANCTSQHMYGWCSRTS
jgi:hypothetical protein